MMRLTGDEVISVRVGDVRREGELKIQSLSEY